MPDVTSPSVSQDVDENKDHKQDENFADQKEVENSDDNKEDESSKDHKEDESSEDKKEDMNHNEANKIVTSQREQFCKVCLVKLTSKGQADTHFVGLRHKKAVALLIEHIKKMTPEVADKDSSAEVADKDSSAEVADKDSSAEVAVEDRSADVTDEIRSADVTDEIRSADVTDEEIIAEVEAQNEVVKKAKKIDFFCEICLVKLTSTSQIDVHHEGKKHKRALEILKDHPRSLAQLAANQDSQTLEDDDHLINVCVVKPTSRSPDDPPCEGSKHTGALAEKTKSLNNAATKQDGSVATSQNTDKDSDETGETPPQKKSKKKKTPKGEEIVCSVCLVKMTSKSQADKHNEGNKHKRALAIVERSTKPTNPIVGNQKTCTDIAVQNFRQNANRNTGVQRVPYLMQNASRIKPMKDNECMCKICVVKLTSTLQAVMHYEGRQHKKAAAVVAGNTEQKLCEGTKKKPAIVCEVCHVTLSSQVVADAHYAGLKHSKKLQLVQSLPGKSSEAASDGGSQGTASMVVISRASSQVTESSSISIMSPAGVLSEEQRKALVGNFFSCDVCNVKVNSQQQMESHWQGQCRNRVPCTCVEPSTRATSLDLPPDSQPNTDLQPAADSSLVALTSYQEILEPGVG